MIEAMPGSRACRKTARRGHGSSGAGRVGAAGRAGAARRATWRGAAGAGRGWTWRFQPPPFFSAVSATMAPATPGIALDDAFRGGAQRLHLLRTCGRHRDRREDLLVGDEDVRDETKVDDVAGEIRTVHRLQAIEDSFLGD